MSYGSLEYKKGASGEVTFMRPRASDGDLVRGEGGREGTSQGVLGRSVSPLYLYVYFVVMFVIPPGPISILLHPSPVEVVTWSRYKL